MGFLGRLFGKKEAPLAQAPATDVPTEQSHADADAAEEAGETRLTLQVLYPQPPTLDGEGFIKALARLHPSMSKAVLEAQNVQGAGEGVVAWGPYRVELHIRKHPLPPDV